MKATSQKRHTINTSKVHIRHLTRKKLTMVIAPEISGFCKNQVLNDFYFVNY